MTPTPPESPSVPAPAAVARSAPTGAARRWLVKTEPSEYAWADLERERRAVWNGIANPLALRHLRSMRRGDAVLVYHTGNEKAVVGLARVARGPYEKSGQKARAKPSPKDTAVDLTAVRRAATPVPLGAI